jgi:hypothetical protein
MGESDKTPRRSAKKARCAIYTRKSSEEGLEQAFNSLDAQREACAAFILSQKHEGWTVLPALYDDGGFSGGTMERPRRPPRGDARHPAKKQRKRHYRHDRAWARLRPAGPRRTARLQPSDSMYSDRRRSAASVRSVAGRRVSAACGATRIRFDPACRSP